MKLFAIRRQILNNFNLTFLLIVRVSPSWHVMGIGLPFGALDQSFVHWTSIWFMSFLNSGRQTLRASISGIGYHWTYL